MIESERNLEQDGNDESQVDGVDAGKQNESDGILQVIGKVKQGLRKRLQTPLPKWVKEYNSFPRDINSVGEDDCYNIECLANHLDPLLLETCRSKGINKFFPVQKATIPSILASLEVNQLQRCRDICVASPTGSGKTLAFVLPIVQYLMNKVRTQLGAIIILPVRDLAFQVFKVLEDFTSVTTLRAAISVGHKSFQEDMDILVKREDNSSYRSLVDILVTTPSRLIDLIHSCPGFDLSHLKILVLDEVDRIIDFDVEYNWLKEIDNAVYSGAVHLCGCGLNDGQPSDRSCMSCVSGCTFNNYSHRTQSYVKLLFSATLSRDIDNLHTLNLFQPILWMAADDDVENNLSGGTKFISKEIIPAELEEKFALTTLESKPLVLWYMMTKLGFRKVLCFTRTIKHAKLLASLLRSIPDLRIFEFSSNMKDKRRDIMLNKFKEGDFDLIIATDIMTRGIDIDGIQYVISYDMPFDDIQYIHRIGRTARAGQKGTAITLLTPDQTASFSALLRKIHPRHLVRQRVKRMIIREAKLNSLRKEYKAALKKLKKETTAEDFSQNSFKKSIRWKGLPLNQPSIKQGTWNNRKFKKKQNTKS